MRVLVSPPTILHMLLPTLIGLGPGLGLGSVSLPSITNV